MALERRKVWQCVGCGRIDDPRPCVGVCRDEKLEFVSADEHDQALAALVKVARAIATTTPHEGECLRHWRALQQSAREALACLD